MILQFQVSLAHDREQTMNGTEFTADDSSITVFLPKDKTSDSHGDTDSTQKDGTSEEGVDNSDRSLSTDSSDSHTNPGGVKNSLFLILSGLYGILLVVLGSVIPLTQSFVEADHPYAFEAFYIYLYVVSILFLVYVYAYLLRRRTLRAPFLTRTFTSRNWTRSKLMGDNSSMKSKRGRRVSIDVSPHTGSFYLRLGAVGFGIGSMIHSGLHFGQYLVIGDGGTRCADVIQAVKPFLHLIFTFSQLYFIFLNSKMCIHRYKILARFGLMHMCAANICVWFRCIVVETLHVIHAQNHTHNQSHHHQETISQDGQPQIAISRNDFLNASPRPTDNSSHHYGQYHSEVMTTSCYWNAIMSQLVDSSGPYLYPCTIEYSLMCAGILYVMWKNVGRRRRRRQSDEENDDEEHLRTHRMSVDCAGSSRGLFLGILLTVGAIISIIAFYVLSAQEALSATAIVLTHLSGTCIYLLTTVALLIAAVKMKDLHFHSEHKGDLEDTLILISYTGLLCFSIFSLVAAILHPYDERSVLTIISNVMMVIQATVQTIFILAGERMSAASSDHVRRKPGRQLVTFLLLCNFAMWAMKTFQIQKPEHNPIQVEFYGPEAWAIFTHISVPLGIYYRFHSSVCLSNIWKNAWKIRKHI